jgi:hypothetical protein
MKPLTHCNAIDLQLVSHVIVPFEGFLAKGDGGLDWLGVLHIKGTCSELLVKIIHSGMMLMIFGLPHKNNIVASLNTFTGWTMSHPMNERRKNVIPLIYHGADEQFSILSDLVCIVEVLCSALKDTYGTVVSSIVSGNTSQTTLCILNVSSWTVLTDYEYWCTWFYSASCFRCVSD